MTPALTDLMTQCAPLISPVTMTAIIRQESGGNPYAINDNTVRLPVAPKTKEEAVVIATQRINAGHSVDMGLTQINSKNLKKLGLTVEQIFEPCTNLKASQSILLDAWEGSKGSLIGTLSAYNTGKTSSVAGLKYAQQVIQRAGGQFHATKTSTTPMASPMNSSLKPKGF